MKDKKIMSTHSMITRSQQKIEGSIKPKPKPNKKNDDNSDDIDEYGNIKDFIDYDCNKEYDENAFKKEILKIKNKKKNKKLKKTKPNIADLLLPYLFMNILDDKKENIAMEVYSSDDDSENDDSENDDSENDDSENDDSENDDSENDDLDEYDEKYCEIVDNDIDDEEEDFVYFHNLKTDQKKKHLEEIKDIQNINKSNIPLRFRILESDMDINTKAIALSNVEKLNELDTSSGEYCKMDKWVNGLLSIPFGKNVELPICYENKIEDKRDYLMNTKKILDSAIYGHQDAKTHILQVIGKWIQNPKSHGNVLAIQGPMGNGKTTLVKDGISKSMDRPFSFIALGGASDASFFSGHPYTYEGSHWGRIADILMTTKCMNPVIYFDELDKVSNTHKGDEIIHLLTHLTDPSQNTLFQDNYFPGINFDLSKVLFIFSFNDESKIDRILKDRMYVINTKGFKSDEKIKICNEYLLPELLNTFMFQIEDIQFTDETIKYIIENYTQKEEGVRNLKRCLETIISKINLYYLSKDKENNKNNIEITFNINELTFPIKVTNEIIKDLLKINKIDGPPEHMYM